LSWGGFQSLNGQTRHWLGRLNTNGTTDLTFNPAGAGGGNDILGVYCLAIQTDGKIIVGGGFRSLGGKTTVRYLGRLAPNGTVDLGFAPQFSSNPNFSVATYATALLADGGIIAGMAESLSNTNGKLAKLNNTSILSETFVLTNNSISWRRNGGSPELWRTEFASSTNQVDWTSLGAGNRISNGWILSGITFPANGVIRARGFVAGGSGNGSGWFIESYSRPMLLTHDGKLGFQSNRFGFHVAAGLGQTVIIDASTNLQYWSPLTTNTLQSAPFYFSDSDKGNSSSRFYGARFK
jgi:hypothetical protein